METTIDLLARAVAGAPSKAALARELKVSPPALNKAEERGRLSPTLAGQIAAKLGEDATRWTALAALEAEPATTARDKLRRLIERARNSCNSRLVNVRLPAMPWRALGFVDRRHHGPHGRNHALSY